VPPAVVSVPPWLRHALTAQRGPVPWNAVLRGALACGPLLLICVLAGAPTAGVLAALGAMLAGVNDRPGSGRAAVARLGAPALAGAGGLLIGTWLGLGAGAVALTASFVVCGLVGGALSAVGPVTSACTTQLLVTMAVGAGMPLPESAPERALLFLAGAALLLVLRLVLPTPVRGSGPRRFDGERAAVAAVYDAVGALLDAVGTPATTARRAALTAALDQAQDALSGPRLRRQASTAAERRVHAQYAAALPLAEAATALAWSRHAPVPGAAVGPRRLAAAVRAGGPSGPLPAPARGDAAMRAQRISPVAACRKRQSICSGLSCLCPFSTTSISPGRSSATTSANSARMSRSIASLLMPASASTPPLMKAIELPFCGDQ